MIHFRHAIKYTLIATVGIGYVSVTHLALTSNAPPLAVVLFGIIPLGATALVTAWNSGMRAITLSLCVLLTLALFLNLEYLSEHAAWLYFVQHICAMLLLGLMFGSTLGKRHAEALCSRIAIFAIHEPLDATYLHYTWRVTLAWTIYFVLSAIISALLFFFGSLQAWSLFANLLTPVLLGTMFAGEYLIRQRVLPNRAHFSITEIIHAYREYSRRKTSN